MNSAYVPLTVHDYPYRASLYVISSQTVTHSHIPNPANFHAPEKECVPKPFWLFTCGLPPLNIPLLKRRFGPEAQPAHFERCLYTAERLCPSAKYSPDALPVKEVAFRAHARNKGDGGGMIDLTGPWIIAY